MTACSVRSTQKVQVSCSCSVLQNSVLTLFVSKGKLQTKSNKQAVFKIHRKEKFVKSGLFYLSYLPQIFYDHKLSFPLVEEEEDIKSMLHVWECYRLITSSSPAWFGRWETSPVLCRVSLEQSCCGLDSGPWLHTGCCCSLRADTVVMVAWGCILGTAWENITEGALAWKQQLVSPPHHHSSAVPLTSAELQHSWFSVTWEQNWAYILLTGLFSSSFPYAVSMPVTGASWNWQQTQKALFSEPLDLKNFERMLQQAS